MIAVYLHEYLHEYLYKYRQPTILKHSPCPLSAPPAYLPATIPSSFNPLAMSRPENFQTVHEPHPDPQSLTSNPSSTGSGVDYEPHPEKSIQIPLERERIVTSITNLYSGSASEEDMRVYAAEAVYDDPWSYCDTRYKIAGQWYGT